MAVEEANNLMTTIILLEIQGEPIMLSDFTGYLWRLTRCYWIYAYARPLT